MLRKKGIVRKTFLFSALLIVLVTLVSFLILYFAMPQYYLYKKQVTLQKNLDSLALELKRQKSPEACAALISSFVDENNATVLSFASGNALLPELSSPFVSMREGERGNSFYSIIQGKEDGKGGSPLTITIHRENVMQSGVGDDNKITIKTFALESDSAISLRSEVGTELLDHIIAAGTLQPIDEAQGVILSLIPYVLLIGIALGLLLAWIYARQISKPILKLSDAAVKMQRLEPDAKSGLRSDDELGLLSGNLDTLYASLRENIDSLKAEMDKVNRLERSKTEMMQSASHELKTPVAALGGMLDGMIDNVGVYKNKEKYLLECKGQVEKLSLLVNEILNASKADASGREPSLEEVSVDSLVEQVFDEFSADIRENGLRVTKALSPVTITTDLAAISRVLTNLAGNAVRYTPPGGEIFVTLEDGLLSIENQCGPIPNQEISKLFEPFYTRSYNRDKAESGTGLGLYIVKRNLERLGISYEAGCTELGLKISLKL